MGSRPASREGRSWLGAGLAGRLARGLHGLAFSSLWVALAAVLLQLAAALAMGLRPVPAALGLAACGTLVVYNLDRLRDLARDRETSPRRSAFVERHFRSLLGLTCASAALSLLLAVGLGRRVVLVLAPALVLGLLHRRLKRLSLLKSAYISAAWLLVVVGLPAAQAGRAPRELPWVAAILGSALFANAVASSLRDAEAAVRRFGTRAVLATARAAALLGVALAALAPPELRALLWVPLATLAVLLPFRSEEGYGLLVVDGALSVSAGLAAWLLAR